jgi:hypothetical protein
MRQRWGVIVLVLGATLAGCGQTATEIAPLQPTVEVAGEATPSPDSRLQSVPLPQQGSD